MSAELRVIPSKRSVTTLIVRASEMLAEARTIEEVIDARDIARAAEFLVKQRDHGSEAQANAWALTQRAIRRLGELTREIPHGKNGRPPKSETGADPAPLSKNAVIRNMNLNAKYVSRAEKISLIPFEQFEAQVRAETERIVKRSKDSAGVGVVSAEEGYDPDSYGTPAKYVEAARRVMGGIVFDPASNAWAANVIRAERYCTKDDSSLEIPWKYRSIWANYPYSRGLIDQFVTKYLEELRAGHFETSITLVNSSTEVDWYQSLVNVCDLMCLPDHRIAFELHSVPIDQNRYAQTFFYQGPNPDLFEREFEQFGKILVPVRRPE